MTAKSIAKIKESIRFTEKRLKKSKNANEIVSLKKKLKNLGKQLREIQSNRGKDILKKIEVLLAQKRFVEVSQLFANIHSYTNQFEREELNYFQNLWQKFDEMKSQTEQQPSPQKANDVLHSDIKDLSKTQEYISEIQNLKAELQHAQENNENLQTQITSLQQELTTTKEANTLTAVVISHTFNHEKTAVLPEVCEMIEFFMKQFKKSSRLNDGYLDNIVDLVLANYHSIVQPYQQIMEDYNDKRKTR